MEYSIFQCINKICHRISEQNIFLDIEDDFWYQQLDQVGTAGCLNQ